MLWTFLGKGGQTLQPVPVPLIQNKMATILRIRTKQTHEFSIFLQEREMFFSPPPRNPQGLHVGRAITWGKTVNWTDCSGLHTLGDLMLPPKKPQNYLGVLVCLGAAIGSWLFIGGPSLLTQTEASFLLPLPASSVQQWKKWEGSAITKHHDDTSSCINRSNITMSFRTDKR